MRTSESLLFRGGGRGHSHHTYRAGSAAIISNLDFMNKALAAVSASGDLRTRECILDCP